MSTMTAADVLGKAADIIDARGWTRRQLVDETTGCVCAVGAIRTAMLGTPDPSFVDFYVLDDDVRDVYFCVIETLEAELGVTVPEWNDEHADTAVEVANTLRKFAATL